MHGTGLEQHIKLLIVCREAGCVCKLVYGTAQAQRRTRTQVSICSR